MSMMSFPVLEFTNVKLLIVLSFLCGGGGAPSTACKSKAAVSKYLIIVVRSRSRSKVKFLRRIFDESKKIMRLDSPELLAELFSFSRFGQKKKGHKGL
jgi:hypothetical protein